MSSIPKASVSSSQEDDTYRRIERKNVSSKYLPCLIVYGYTNNTRGTSIHHDSLPTIITKQTDKRTSSSFFAFSPVRARELSNNVVAWQWRTFVEWPPREREKEGHILYIFADELLWRTKTRFDCELQLAASSPVVECRGKERGKEIRRRGRGGWNRGKWGKKGEKKKGKMENIAVDMESRVTGFLIGMDDCPTSSDTRPIEVAGKTYGKKCPFCMCNFSRLKIRRDRKERRKEKFCQLVKKYRDNYIYKKNRDKVEKIKLLRSRYSRMKISPRNCLLHLKGAARGQQYTEFPAQRARRIGR